MCAAVLHFVLVGGLCEANMFLDALPFKPPDTNKESVMNNFNPNRASEQLAQLARQGSAHYAPHVPEHQQTGFVQAPKPEKKGWLWNLLNVDRWRQQTRREGEEHLRRVMSGLANEREVEVYANDVRTQVAKYEIEIGRILIDKRMLKHGEDMVRASDVDTVIKSMDAVALTTEYADKARAFIEKNVVNASYKEFGCKQIDLINNLAVVRLRINAVGLKYDADRGNQREYFE